MQTLSENTDMRVMKFWDFTADMIEHEQLVRRWRFILWTIALFYPAWYFAYYILEPHAYDTLTVRILIGVINGATVLGSYFSERIYRKFTLYFYVASFCMIEHCFYLVWMNDMDPGYTIGGLVVVCFAGILYLHIEALMVLYSSALTVAGIAAYRHPDLNHLLFLTGIFTIMVLSLESLRNLVGVLSQLKRSRDHVLDLSAAVQTTFLPSQNHFANEHCEIQGFYRAVDRCGGDWWSYRQRSPTIFSVMVGDVVGHGPGPAMITASVASYFQVLETTSKSSTLGELVMEVNHQMRIASKRIDDLVMTMLGLEFDFGSGHLDAYFAGSHGIFVMHEGSDTVEYVGARGSFLGDHRFNLGHKRIKLRPGDRILVFTDGIVEAEATGRQFGEMRLQRLKAA